MGRKPHRAWSGCPVNPLIKLPDPPVRRVGWRRIKWVDETRCVCGATYAAFRSGETFASAAARLRIMAKGEGDDGGGYRSRRPVLTMLRAMKLEAWYLEHHGCAWFDLELVDGDDGPTVRACPELSQESDDPPLQV